MRRIISVQLSPTFKLHLLFCKLVVLRDEVALKKVTFLAKISISILFLVVSWKMMLTT